MLMHSKGISIRKIAEITDKIFHVKYSGSKISRITDITLPEMEKWKRRSLNKRYISILGGNILLFTP